MSRCPAREQPGRGRHHGAARARERRHRGSAASAALRCSPSACSAHRCSTATPCSRPAITVLSAVEGLEVGTAAFKPYVVPIAVGILVALFADPEARDRGRGPAVRAGVRCCGSRRSAQSASGTSRRTPASSRALNPSHALHFATAHGFASFVVLGSVLLAITGAEALYADMGHFGKRAIRIAWFGLVAPALVLNYFGQGALLMTQPGGDREPVLPVLSRLGALSDGRAGDGGDRDRLAGDDLRRLLDDPAGDPARLPAAHVDPAHVRDARWGRSTSRRSTGCCWARSLIAVVRLRLVVAARLGLRRGGHGHDAGHHLPHLLRHPLRLGLPAAGCACCPRASSLVDRPGLLRGGLAQAPRRRLVPAGCSAPRSSPS